ncbi:hypothetical protein [Ruania halotolerans]|uniref:hypothetical protein n=1 Tax=Ruania halotolerans TaxID=2897773 RepID=UPI001E52F525|nr:hypothetical protein [Ruania halotolerans]UFU08166.1 hypothetical protein LQF10_08765 [Ruania halotolerans]
MRVETRDGVITVHADAYRLEVHPVGVTPPRALVFAPDGAEVAQLSLFASLDRVGAADESYQVHPPRVRSADRACADTRRTDAAATDTVVTDTVATDTIATDTIATDTVETHAGETDTVEIEVRRSSTAWEAAAVVLRAGPDGVRVHAEVTGTGTLTTVRVLGGSAVLPSGACGDFFSRATGATMFTPNPTEPVQWERPASSASVLGILGDAHPGRLHAVFSPPPLAVAIGQGSRWLTAWVRAGIEECTFTEWRYEPLDSGFRFAFDYDAHTDVNSTFRTPEIALRLAADPWECVSGSQRDLVQSGLVPQVPHGASRGGAPRWWSEPLFCGWGAQCARARWGRAGDEPENGRAGSSATGRAADHARQDVYDEFLATLAAQGIDPGTVVIDDKWQAEYGTAVVDTEKWPDLRGWIAQRHAAGQRVLLWWKAWDPEGLPASECILDPAGRPVAADPGNPEYRERLRRVVAHLLKPAEAGGLGADGFKVDFTQRAPAGHHLRGTPGVPWGIAGLHALLTELYAATKAVRPDALVVTHTPNPLFADVTDMVRLNDVLEHDPAGRFVPVADQVRTRARIAAAAVPGIPLDTDQWPMPDRDQWRGYTQAQSALGVPALYYAERIDGSGELLTDDDYALVRRTWAEYRRRRESAATASAQERR